MEIVAGLDIYRFKDCSFPSEKNSLSTYCRLIHKIKLIPYSKHTFLKIHYHLKVQVHRLYSSPVA